MKFNLQQKTSARGYYSVHVLDAEGNDTGKSVRDITNVVTKNGHKQPRFTGQNASEYSQMTAVFGFAAGTGTVEITPDSTGLGTELAVARGDVTDGDGTGFTDNGDGTETFKRVCKGSYPLGHINETVSEIGIFHDGLVAGQLIKDGAGNPTTITVLSDEQLVVTYTIEWTYSKDSIPSTTGTVDVNGVTTTWTLEVTPIKAGVYFKYPYDKGLFEFADGQELLAPDGTSIISKNLDVNKLEDVDGVTRATLGGTWAPSEGAGDVESVVLGNYVTNHNVLDEWCTARIHFSPAIPKTDAEVLEVEVSWDLTGT